MTHVTCRYEGAWRIQYEGGATFVPTCMDCHRFVTPDETIRVGDGGLHPGPNATCSKCGRTRMHFEGFV